MPLEVAMWKTVLAGTTALAIAGASLAFAQQGGSDDFQRVQRWRPTAEDITAFGEARIAALHAGLKLTAEQEKNWPPVEAALRELAKQRSERFAARASADRPKDPIERLKAYLVRTGLADADFFTGVEEEAGKLAQHVRDGCRGLPDPAPLDLFDDVYVENTPLLERERAEFASYLSSFEGAH